MQERHFQSLALCFGAPCPRDGSARRCSGSAAVAAGLLALDSPPRSTGIGQGETGSRRCRGLGGLSHRMSHLPKATHTHVACHNFSVFNPIIGSTGSPAHAIIKMTVSVDLWKTRSRCTRSGLGRKPLMFRFKNLPLAQFWYHTSWAFVAACVFFRLVQVRLLCPYASRRLSTRMLHITSEASCQHFTILA